MSVVFYSYRKPMSVGLAILAFNAAQALGQPKLDDKIGQVLSSRGSARVIVLVSPDFDRSLGSAASVLSEALGDRADVRNVLDLPVAVVETDSSGIDTLVDHPLTESIVLDQLVPPLLRVSVETTGALPVHAQGVLGDGYFVAVLDTGVNYDHPFFVGKPILEGCFSTTSETYSTRSLCPNGLDIDLTDGAGRNCADDVRGCDHGTHVAGIAVGQKTEYRAGEPLVGGVAPEAGLISVQVFSAVYDEQECRKYGRETPCVLSFESDQLEALGHVESLVQERGVEVAAVNMSLGGGFFPRACDETNVLSTQITKLRGLGVPTVIASGNDGYYNAVSSPGCVESAVTVGASYKDRVALAHEFSNTSNFVDFIAPGTTIESAVLSGGFDEKSGTSMAAPHVAGAFALLMSGASGTSAASRSLLERVESAMRSTAQVSADPRTGVELPFPNLDAAMRRLSSEQAASVTERDEWTRDQVVGRSLDTLVGARRIIVQLPSSEIDVGVERFAERLRGLLGRGTKVEPLGGGSYVAERRDGFDSESLGDVVTEFGDTVRLFADRLVAPN